MQEQLCIWLLRASLFTRSFQTNPALSSNQALSQVVIAWQGLASPLKRGKGGQLRPRTKTPPPAHHGRPCPSSQAAPPSWLPSLLPPPQSWAGSPSQRQFTMNEHSALVLQAHLLIKQLLGQPHTPSCPPTLLFQFPLLGPSLWGSPYPLPAAQATCSLCMGGEEPAWPIASGRHDPPSQLRLLPSIGSHLSILVG